MATIAPVLRSTATGAVRSGRAIPALAALLAIYAGMPWIIRPLERFLPVESAALAGQGLEMAIGLAIGLWTIRLVLRHRAVVRGLEHELERVSQGDPMTGLGNGAALARDLELALGRARRTGEPVSLLLLDVDELGQVNRLHGAAVGDRTLRVLASVLRSSARFGTDAAYRVGGDEFAMVLAGDRAAADRVRRRLESNFFERSPSRSGFNTGLATWDGRSSSERLLEQARRELAARQPVALAAGLA